MNTGEEFIEDAEALLLDFDGPVTALMPPPLNTEAAERARRALSGVELPDEVQETSDHLAVLRWTASHAAGRLTEVEHACTEAEVECAGISEPSPEIAGFIASARMRGIPVAIVSNNSDQAVRTFLGRFDWARSIETVSARNVETVRLMKPHPHLLGVAVELLGVAPTRCVFIGDAVSDVQAGRAAGVSVVGLAKTLIRGAELEAAGARALIFR